MIKTTVPYLLSVLTLLMMWAAGKKKNYAWKIGLFNQIFWLTFILTYKAYGLLPLTLCLIGIYIKNNFEWNKK